MASSLKSNRMLALPLGLTAVALAIQKNGMDPLNPIKLWVLGALAAWCCADLLTTRPWNVRRITASGKYFLGIISVFVIGLVVALITTDVKTIGLVGDSGRNIGFLNYVFLAVIALYASLKIDKDNLKYLFFTAEILLFALTSYGFFQHFKVDFLKWHTLYNPIILTVGNPDFASSLLAILLIVCTGCFFYISSRTYKALLLAQLLLSVLVIYWTQALQGLVAIALGLAIFAYLYSAQKYKNIARVLLAEEILAGAIGIMGMLKIGPLASHLYKSSVQDRGYDWQAALSMFKAHPLTGVGLDRYGAYFNQYRSPQYPLIYGYQQTVTNAHNVFLEFFATGGLLVGLAYILLIVFIGWRAVLLLRNNSGRQQMLLAALVAGWTIFIAQSFISVDSLAISIWGWVLGAGIVGLSFSVKEIGTPPSTSQRGRSIVQEAPPLRGVVFIGLLLSLLVFVVPMYNNETGVGKFVNISVPSNTQTQTQDLYSQLAAKNFNQFLMSPSYKYQIAISVAKNGDVNSAIKYLNASLESDKRYLQSYVSLASIYESMHFINFPMAIQNRLQIKKYDPYNAQNLVNLENDYILTKNMGAAIATRDSILEMAPGTDLAKQATILITKIGK